MLVACTQAVLAGSGGPAGAAVPAQIRVDGHGWGHGRGMGQFGAYGYAVEHGWTGRMILDHFYGGTVTTQMGSSPDQRVLLTGRDGKDLILCTTAGRHADLGRRLPGHGAARCASSGSARTASSSTRATPAAGPGASGTGS